MLSAEENSEKELSKMTKQELVEAAEKVGVENAESKTKAKLISEITNARGDPSG